MEAQQVFYILLPALLLYFSVFFSFSQWFWACLKHFEAISQMTCFVNIFIQFPFVMQMAVTLSISEKADACWMDSLKLWWCGVLTAVSDCNVNCLWWGGCLTASLTRLNHTHTIYKQTHTHTHLVGSHACASVLPITIQPLTCTHTHKTQCASRPPHSPKNLQHICLHCISSSSSFYFWSCSAPLTMARCLPITTQLFISRPSDRRWCNCSLRWSMKTERKGEGEKGKRRERQKEG